jgi:lipoate---protein ligase
MELLDLTFPTPEENLACDEALLEMCEQGYDREILRLWEPPSYFVVLGYSAPANAEIFPDPCRAAGVPILRRYSGGGTVVQGPGCLDYTLILRIETAGPLSTISGTNTHVMERQRRAIESIYGESIRVRGHTDLAIGALKFSGNAQRRKARFLLFHGVFLLNFDLMLIPHFLPHPSREPSYRNGRAHEQFVRNLNLPASAVKHALCMEWSASTRLESLPEKQIADLARTRYSSPAWTYRIP